jgi:hypothetical protein
MYRFHFDLVREVWIVWVRVRQAEITGRTLQKRAQSSREIEIGAHKFAKSQKSPAPNGLGEIGALKA